MDFSQSHAIAMNMAYMSLVKVLHQNGQLDVADLVNDLGNTVDAQRKLGDGAKLSVAALEVIYRQILELEKALPKQ